MIARAGWVLAVLLIVGLAGPAQAVFAEAPTCYPDGRCVTCVEYENSGGQSRCVKCARNPRCRGRPNSMCRFRPYLPQCRQPQQYFTPDGLPDTSPRRRPWYR